MNKKIILIFLKLILGIYYLILDFYYDTFYISNNYNINKTLAFKMN